MAKKQIIKIFEEKNVRTVWDDKEEKWYFSIVDVVEVLTDSADPKQYIKKMRKRDPQLDANWGTICTLVQMKGADGKSRKQMAADTEGMFRLIHRRPEVTQGCFDTTLCDSFFCLPFPVVCKYYCTLLEQL